MSNPKNDNGSAKTTASVIGCLSTILAAVISGVFLLISTGVIRVSFPFPQNKPTAVIELNCYFIDELVTKEDVIQILDVPKGSGFYAGVQIRLISSVDVPAGWIVHRDAKEYQGPIHLDTGTVASIWPPESCRPLNIH